MSVKTLEELESNLHSKHLLTLNLYRFIQSKSFKEAYFVASEEEQNIAEKIIDALDKTKLIGWVKRQLKEHNLIEVLCMSDLRALGQQLGVRNYAILTRLELISNIEKSSIKKESSNGTIKGN